MVEMINVTKNYDNGTKALKNINIKIDNGEFVFIVGSSGAGKSTLLKLLLHEELPNEGTINVNGQNLNTMKKRQIPYFRRKIGVVFQDFRLIEHMTVYDNIAFSLRVIGENKRKIKYRVSSVIKVVGLTEKTKCYPHELSGGEQQRVGLARALVNNPDFIIADEPTGNIDPMLSFEIVDLLNEINKRGTTILMVTHEHSLVRRFHRRVIEINDGQVVADTKLINKLPANKGVVYEN